MVGVCVSVVSVSEMNKRVREGGREEGREAGRE